MRGNTKLNYNEDLPQKYTRTYGGHDIQGNDSNETTGRAQPIKIHSTQCSKPRDHDAVYESLANPTAV